MGTTHGCFFFISQNIKVKGFATLLVVLLLKQTDNGCLPLKR